MSSKKISQFPYYTGASTDSLIIPVVDTLSNINYIITKSDLSIMTTKSDVYYGLNANDFDSSTTSICQYGVNVFTSVTQSDYCTKLPQPSTGRSCKISNMSNAVLMVYPSNVGGQINNLPIDTAAALPPDGKLYEFICVRNPLPGAWTFSAPATEQYDSGEIITDVTQGQYASIMAVNSSNYGERNGFYSGSWYYNGKNKPLILKGTDLSYPDFSVAFKESKVWNGMTKLKVYTNLSHDTTITFGLTSSLGSCYYDLVTGELLSNGPSSSTNFGDYGYCVNVVDGTPIIPFSYDEDDNLTGGTIQPNIGDPGTLWGEIDLAGVCDALGCCKIGDFDQGTVPFPYNHPWDGHPIGTLVSKWYSGYLGFAIQPRINITGFKFRFFIEHF